MPKIEPTLQLRLQTQAHAQAPSDSLLVSGSGSLAAIQLDECVRAARLLKFAARTAGLQESEDLANAMEDCFSVARQSELAFDSEQLDLMLRGVDVLRRLALFSQYGETKDLGAAGSSAPARQPSTARRADGDASKKSKRVLVVDDSLEGRELLHRLLSRRGYEVEIAVDGVDAWNAIRSGSFDLVLTDSDMPLVDGIRLTKLIRKDPRFESLPVLIVFDQDCEQDKRRGFEAGADHYVVKGASQDTLAQTVASLIGPGRA